MVDMHECFVFRATSFQRGNIVEKYPSKYYSHYATVVCVYVTVSRREYNVYWALCDVLLFLRNLCEMYEHVGVWIFFSNTSSVLSHINNKIKIITFCQAHFPANATIKWFEWVVSYNAQCMYYIIIIPHLFSHIACIFRRWHRRPFALQPFNIHQTPETRVNTYKLCDSVMLVRIYMHAIARETHSGRQTHSHAHIREH